VAQTRGRRAAPAQTWLATRLDGRDGRRYPARVVDRSTAMRLLAALGRTRLGDAPTLVGSSGLFGFATEVPAFTEDVDVAVPVALLATHEAALLDELATQGFIHHPGTATFIDPRDGTTFDLLGVGEPSDGDHIGGGPRLPVMVFEDLSRASADPRATHRLEHGHGLTPAGFVAVKLLTERAHKGAKDKIQALLVLAERREDPAFLADLRGLLGRFDPGRLEDAVADAQGAFLALAQDPAFRDAGAEGYRRATVDAERGLAALLELLRA